ncbi:MAG: DUF192 domain-containing protein [Kiritimatiellae bacterium]|nr:DUF192 domain-containing protein [Kiritimatiellia bacterium]
MKKLVQTKTNKIIADELIIATSTLMRAIGLLGRKTIRENFGIMFPSCRSIHTHFMLFSIDIIFVDENNCITELKPDLSPWKILIAKNKQSKHIIELHSGIIQANNLLIGDCLKLI